MILTIICSRVMFLVLKISFISCIFNIKIFLIKNNTKEKIEIMKYILINCLILSVVNY